MLGNREVKFYHFNSGIHKKNHIFPPTNLILLSLHLELLPEKHDASQLELQTKDCRF